MTVLIDSRTVPNASMLETDVCIIGTGAAGLTLAREFAGRNFQVCVLESGGMQRDSETQSLYEGQIVGLPHIPLTWPRDRYFGGTTNTWTGQCRPLDPSDFEQREWIPHSGWPFLKSHLDPFYERAHSVCQLGTYSYEVDDWLYGDLRTLPFVGNDVVTNIFQLSPPTRFGEVYRKIVETSENTKVYLFANVIEIDTNDMGSRATRVRVATLEGNTFSVQARIFVLATGGIENARVLLLSDRIHKNGLGNQNDMVGRFFMQHLLFPSGLIRIDSPDVSAKLYLNEPKLSPVHKVPFRGMMSLSEDQRRREKIAAIGMRLLTTEDHSIDGTVAEDRTTVDDAVRQLASPNAASIWRLWNMTEQIPNPDSRITLAPERDRLGLRQVQLDWRLSSLDKKSVRRTHQLLGQALGHAGLGRVKCELNDDDTSWTPVPKGGHHHMGTTKMHVDAKRGVVDEHCKVHGVSNLYIAGSSVFPTGGFANPTLTIVALALRLADHIRRKVA